MLPAVAERLFNDLHQIRWVLDGDKRLDKLPPMPDGMDEDDHRRMVAIALIDDLCVLVSELASVAKEASQTLVDLAHDPELDDEPPMFEEPVDDEPRIFGFAAYRQAA
jgi:hypothetical protein